MSLKIDIDSAGITKDLMTAGSELNRAFVRSLKSSGKIITREARIIHRYVTRSGVLDKSIRSEVDSRELLLNVYLDTGIANYGPFQHDGTITRRKGPKWPGNRGQKVRGGIKADPFITIATQNRISDVFKRIATGIAKGLVKAKLI